MLQVVIEHPCRPVPSVRSVTSSCTCREPRAESREPSPRRPAGGGERPQRHYLVAAPLELGKHAPQDLRGPPSPRPAVVEDDDRPRVRGGQDPALREPGPAELRVEGMDGTERAGPARAGD